MIPNEPTLSTTTLVSFASMIIHRIESHSQRISVTNLHNFETNILPRELLRSRLNFVYLNCVVQKLNADISNSFHNPLIKNSIQTYRTRKVSINTK